MSGMLVSATPESWFLDARISNKNRENKRIACKYIQMHKNSYVIVKIQ